MTDKALPMRCESCASEIRVPRAFLGRAIRCPKCKAKIDLTDHAPPMPPPVEHSVEAPGSVEKAKIVIGHPSHSGWVILFVVCMIGFPFAGIAAVSSLRPGGDGFGFMWLIADVVGLVVFYQLTNPWQCTACGTILNNKKVTICPGCRSRFDETQ